MSAFNNEKKPENNRSYEKKLKSTKTKFDNSFKREEITSKPKKISIT